MYKRGAEGEEGECLRFVTVFLWIVVQSVMLFHVR